MRKTCTGIIAGVAGALLLSALAAAQQSDAPRSPWKYYPEDARANNGRRRARAEARSDRDMGRRVIWRGC